MRYFWKDGVVFGYNDAEVFRGLTDGLTELTPLELDAHLNPPEEVPTHITKRQCCLYLLSIDLLDTVEGMLSGDKYMEVEWNAATIIERTHPFVYAIQYALSKTSEEMDVMFIAASKL